MALVIHSGIFGTVLMFPVCCGLSSFFFFVMFLFFLFFFLDSTGSGFDSQILNDMMQTDFSVVMNSMQCKLPKTTLFILTQSIFLQFTSWSSCHSQDLTGFGSFMFTVRCQIPNNWDWEAEVNQG